MRIKKNLLYKFVIIALSISSCTKNNNQKNISVSKKNEIEKKQLKKTEHKTSNEFYYYSTKNNKKFDYRVTGVDENNKKVNGVINLENEIGIGILRANDSNEIEIVSEDINYKEIIATDINGIKYKLKFD